MIKEDTILITVTSASNEIGTLEPVKEIGKIAREKGVVFHTGRGCLRRSPADRCSGFEC